MILSFSCVYWSYFFLLLNCQSMTFIHLKILFISGCAGSSLLCVGFLCPTLCNPMDYTVHRILQARILKWVAFPFSRRSSQPRDQTQVFHISDRFFTSWAKKKALRILILVTSPFSMDFPNPGIELGSPALQMDSLPTELLGNPFLGEKQRKTIYFVSYEKQLDWKNINFPITSRSFIHSTNIYWALTSQAMCYSTGDSRHE